MKKLVFLLAAFLTIALIGTPICFGQTPGLPNNGAEEKPEAKIITARNTSGDLEMDRKRYTMGYKGDLTVSKLAWGLSSVTGLDFTVKGGTIEENKVTVNWSDTSTLLAGLDDREQKEEYFFYDADSLNLFMLDSMFHTIIENFGYETEVYYTMGDGKQLIVPNFSHNDWLRNDLPFMGSGFYFHHEDGRGDITEEEACDVLIKALGDKALEGKKVVMAGGKMVDSDYRWHFSVGTDTQEKFTAEDHYAVSVDGTIYKMNILDGGTYTQLNFNPNTGC